ncbi:MAG: hypothetical protein NC412_11395 [Roseburia sp.]|nr:hypothetical protein [Roseburia sp.]MCM1279314.1 hypothetical protein [Robinsoniella sp.]
MDALLAICDYEKKYVYKLAEYLSGKKRFPFRVMAFDNIEKLGAFLKENPVEILLLGEAMKEEALAKTEIGQIFYLSEENRESSPASPFIYKYQSGTAIMKKIIELYAEGEGERKVQGEEKGKGHMEIIGVYSPIGRCLQTSFSLILGQILAKEKRCLYLNFEAYSGFSKLLEKEFQHDFMDLMYFLKEGSGKFVYKLASMVDSIGNLDFIPPAVSFLDILEMEGEKWQLLLDELERSTDYEAVILDLSDNVRGLFEILERCSRIYTITKPDGMALAKIDQYEKLLTYIKKEALLKKTVTCKIPVFKQVPYKMIYLSHSQLADYVKNMLKEQEK